METLYDIFKIREDAPPEIIKAAYKALSNMFHPDKNPGDEAAAEMMKKVNRAYAILRDPELRARYDEALHHARAGAQSAAPPSDAGMQPGSPPTDNSHSHETTESKSKAPWWSTATWWAFYVVMARLIGILGILVIIGVFYWLKPRKGTAVALLASVSAGFCVAFFAVAVVRPELSARLDSSSKVAAMVAASTNGMLLPGSRLPEPVHTPNFVQPQTQPFAYEQAYSHPPGQAVPPTRQDHLEIELAKLDQWHPGWRQKAQSRDFQWWLERQDAGVRNSFATTESATQLNVILKQYDQWVITQQLASSPKPRKQTPEERWAEINAQRKRDDAAEALSRRYGP